MARYRAVTRADGSYVYKPDGSQLMARAVDQPRTIDCRSEAGVTIGLIDSMITSARVIAGRDLSDPDVIEALKDIQSDGDVLAIVNPPPAPRADP